MYPVTYASSRLALRELTVDDVDAVHAIYGSPKATEHLSFEPRTRDQVAHLIAGAMVSATAQPRTEYNLAACRADDGALIGFGRIARDPHAQQAATMGFALHPEAWGVGYGTETARALISLSLNELKLHRVWAARAPKNIASEKTLLSAGMTKEGRIRHHVHVRGAWRDSITYSAVADDWNDTLTSANKEN